MGLSSSKAAKAAASLAVQLERTPSGRLIIIGDVHGCYDELQLLLDHCNYAPGSDALFFVGDLVNKGPKSPQVLDFVSQAKAFVTRGNHDEAALTQYGKLQRGEQIKPKFSWVDQLRQDQLDYLNSLPFTVSFPELQLLLVHAGVVPGVPLKKQELTKLFKMRNVLQAADGSWQGDEASDEGQAWAKVWTGPQHVFFGHDAKRRLQLEQAATGLDSGCVYGGQLTAAVLPPAKDIAERLSNRERTGRDRGPSLQELGGTIIAVDALQEYEVKKGGKTKDKKSKEGEGQGKEANANLEGDGGVGELDDDAGLTGNEAAGHTPDKQTNHKKDKPKHAEKEKNKKGKNKG